MSAECPNCTVCVSHERRSVRRVGGAWGSQSANSASLLSTAAMRTRVRGTMRRRERQEKRRGRRYDPSASYAATLAGSLVWLAGSLPMTTNLTTYSALMISCTACFGDVGTTSSIERIESPCHVDRTRHVDTGQADGGRVRWEEAGCVMHRHCPSRGATEGLPESGPLAWVDCGKNGESCVEAAAPS